jgi:hypothetical protein
MMKVLLAVVIGFSLSLAACKPEAKEMAAAPKATPHPATGARQHAVQLYPQLAVSGSTFNLTFLDLYQQASMQQAETLAQPDWPLVLAHKTATLLAERVAAPAPVASGGPAPGVAMPDADSRPNPLDRGAYNRTRGPGRALIYNPYWNRTTPFPAGGR